MKAAFAKGQVAGLDDRPIVVCRYHEGGVCERTDKRVKRELEIIYEDDDVLAVLKPPGIPVQTKDITGIDMASLVRAYLSGKGIDARGIEPPHRLDTPVGGLLVFGKHKKAAQALSTAFSERRCQKKYYALVCGKVEPPEALLKNYIRKDPKLNKGVSCLPSEKGAKEALLKYRVLNAGELIGNFSSASQTEDRPCRTLLDIELLTGRFHQIRTQLSAIGHPILGDVKYGAAPERDGGKEGIALFSYRLRIEGLMGNKTLDLDMGESPVTLDFLKKWF